MRRMRIACWIPKATNKHSEYVILPLQYMNGCKVAPQYYVTLLALIFFCPRSLYNFLQSVLNILVRLYWIFRFLCLVSRRIFANIWCSNSSCLIQNFLFLYVIFFKSSLFFFTFCVFSSSLHISAKLGSSLLVQFVLSCIHFLTLCFPSAASIAIYFCCNNLFRYINEVALLLLLLLLLSLLLHKLCYFVLYFCFTSFFVYAALCNRADFVTNHYPAETARRPK